MAKKRRKRCDICHELKDRDDIEKVVNPYTQDIDGIEEEEWICTDCYDSLVDDI